MKRTLFLIGAVMCVLCFSGCSLFTDGDDMELTQEEIEQAGHAVSGSVSGSSVSEIKTLSIYTIDGIEEQLVPLKVPIGSERVTPELIMNKVLENIDEKVVVTEIDVEKSTIYVSFSDEYAPLAKCSVKYETLILDCVANSLLDNVSYVDKVIFRSEQGAYKSQNYKFGLDEVYRSK